MFAAAIAGVAAVMAPAPAHAAAPAQCQFTDTVCLFSATGYTASRLTLTSLAPEGTCVSLVDAGWGGRARSALNTAGSSAALFANDDCIGGPFQVPANGGVSNLGSFQANSIWVP
ncbi:hypothetical protein Acy02nite_34260 [Actinoplanes cyaneus]|uniref:Peptidase inhibitor family I36 n=1 Tax=Actinoplanes cyaneus TaxID=52696 RepID=A0A919IP30_9ACTN|nr:peptidase inhibitor family I36 protein [Actinoplanes cyaneus]GID65545.1 hypothetical protein Acy02nite_34260 [Actinoplanes cyaneus]